MTVKRRITTFVLLLAIVFTMGGELFSAFVVKANAATVTYSSVLDDLGKDSSFNLEDYPSVADDYSLKVIQIAEAIDGALYLYVYKPSGDATDIVASSVNMSNTGQVSGIGIYDLKLISSEGVFQKYLIEGLTRKEEYTRKYLVIEISRPWNESYGDTTQEGVVGVERAYPVEVIFTCHTAADGRVTTSAEYTSDTISVTDSCSGYIYYRQATASGNTGYRSHYYAFSTNKPIDAIRKVYIEFDYNYHLYRFTGGFFETPTKEDYSDSRKVTLMQEDVVTLPSGSFWFEWWNQYKYDYPRINSTEDFLGQEGFDLSSESKNAIGQQEWVLRYYESDYNLTYITGLTYEEWTNITAINLFRLEYEYDGKIYDVGVISDTITEDTITDGYGVPTPENEPWWQTLVMLLGIAIILSALNLLSGPIKILFDIIWNGVKAVIGFIISVITAPFRLIWRLLFPK